MSKNVLKKVVSAVKNELVSIAKKALDDKAFVSSPSRCQQFVREVVQAKHGNRFDKYHKKNAHLSALAWQKSPYAVDPKRGSVPGDILYKFGTRRNPDGHVGVRIPGNLVAENSVVHNSKTRGAKGVRTVAQFGKVDLIVRLPDA